MKNAKEYAIIQTGGKQYRVAVGDVIDVELIQENADNKVEFTEVLFASSGSKTHIGAPSIPNFSVRGDYLGVVKGDKVTGLKYKKSHNERRKWGHRQRYARVKITAIAHNV